MKCEDYDDLLPVVSNYTIFDCSVAVAYGACELEPVVFNHMCCESCSNPTCQDYDDVIAAIWDNPMMDSCKDAALYGMCVDDNVFRICCESCSNPTCEDHDDIVATWDMEMVDSCKDAALYGMCADDNVFRICCDSFSDPACEDDDDFVASWGYGDYLDTCSEGAMYGMCDDDNFGARICCETCSALESDVCAQFPSLGVFLFWETYGVVLEPLART